MAKVLEDFPQHAKNAARYPWDEWLDGKPRQFTRGVDFAKSIQSFRTAAYEAAKTRGVLARTHVIDDDTIVIQSYLADGQE